MFDNIENPSSVYLAGRQEWNERYGGFIAERRWSRWTILALTGALCFSVACNVWQSERSTVVPYIVRENEHKEVIDVRPLPIPSPPNEAQIVGQLSQFITDIRTVYSDPSAVMTTALQAYGWVDKHSHAQGLLDAWFQANNPNKRAAKEGVGVTIEAVSKIGTNTWQVDWSETHVMKDGMAPTKDYWRANIGITIATPTDPKSLIENPNGIWIQWFNVSTRPGVIH